MEEGFLLRANQIINLPKVDSVMVAVFWQFGVQCIYYEMIVEAQKLFIIAIKYFMH